MSSTFGSFNIAVSALRYNQTAMDVASTNIANADVEGYTRRILIGETQVVGGMPRLWSRGENYGAGVQVGDVQRTFDALLEARYRGETARLSSDTVRADVLASIEGSLGEPGDTGLQASLTQFWNSWSSLAANPSDPSARQQVLSNATAVVMGLHRIAGTIDTEWSGQHEALSNTVDTVNLQAGQLASLNHEIRVATASDVDVNGLLDRRDKLVASIAQLTGGTTSYSTDGMASVTVAGQLLVDGQTAHTIDVSGATTIGAQSSTPVTLSIGGTAITPSSGTIGGQLDALTTILPTQLASLDTVASQLASQVNALHHTGYDATGAAGGNVFSGTTASTIALAITGPDQVAASNAAGTRDGSVAQAIARLASAAGGPDSVYRAFVAGVSTQADLANNTVDSQAALVQSVSAARSSVAGVNIDEEMVNLLAAQRGYEASSRVLTTLDSVLDTLINRTGVG